MSDRRPQNPDCGSNPTEELNQEMVDFSSDVLGKMIVRCLPEPALSKFEAILEETLEPRLAISKVSLEFADDPIISRACRAIDRQLANVFPSPGNS
ncbi:hypothetical protein J3R74_000266 [Puniceicoccus vermicola]